MKRFYFLLLILLLLSLSACRQEKPVLMHNTGEALGTTYSIQYESEEDYHAEIRVLYRQVNQSLSTYQEDSDISRINRGEVVEVDSLFIEVFEASEEIWQATDGYFDPTVGALVNAYGFGPGKKLQSFPETALDSMMAFVGWDKVHLSVTGSIDKSDPRVFLDFNSIAKGYTLDLVGRLLDEKGVENYLIEIGGEVLARGLHPVKEKPWQVAIDDPTQADDPTWVTILPLRDRAMATSGNYRKYYIDPETGEKYVHSINPKTGKPQKTNVLSATVFAISCMEADAYATAFMVMDLESTRAFLEKHPALDAFILFLDESQQLQEFRTPGFLEMMEEERL